ncbi:MAG: right-handed parallel beta-helix repeat-containing protein [Candidatus Saccharimonas sp.]
MTVWYHQSTILKQRRALRTAGLVTLCVAFITTLLFSAVSHAATGINKTLSFQGRLQSSSGAIVADGYYNIQFKIYQDGSGTTAGNPDGTLKWTESYVNNNGTSGVQVKNGYFSVTLGSKTAFGSSVDWNQDTLWLSMNVAGTASTCTTFGSGSCTADGEMLPMKRLTSTPYALNAGAVGGLSSSDLIHNQNTAQQTSSNFWISGTGRADTALQAPAVDTATAGTLTIGGTNATSITMADDVTVAAGKSLTLAGGNTASRPASPAEGMLYYDTSTKQLLVYSDGKWKSDGKSATKIVAASDSSQALKDGADYVADGTSDQSEINSALTAAAGGRVYLAEGTYTIDGSISVPNNTTLAGAGSGTTIKLKNSINADINALVATDTTTGTGVTLTNFRIDGNKSNNSSGTQNGIYFINMGGGNGASARQGAKISELWISNLRSYGIMLENSNNSVLTENHINNNSMGLHLKNDVYLTVTNNVIQYNSRGIYATPLYYSTINANTIESSTAYGMLIEGSSSGNTITGNTISTTTTAGLALSTATDNTVSGNHFRNSGGSTTNEAITLNSASTGNNLAGNGITDSSATTNNYAIHVIDSASTGNYISDNSLGGGSISDAATTNIYANQLDASGKLINKSAAGAGIQTTTNNTTAFTVQNASGTSALTVDTTSNSVLVAGALDTTTAAAMTIGSTSASSITIGKSASNISTTLLGTVLVKPTTGNDSTTAFQIQRANGTAMFTADSTNQTITFGNAASGNYTVISTSTGTITKYGTARNTKSITLTPEFAGAVLDAQSDSACTSASNGTMTAGLDSVGRTNYYNWTSTQGTNQCYDVVVQVPVPAGFSGWQSTAISMKASNTSNASYGIAIIDSNGSYDANYGSSYASPGTLSTSWSNVATSSLSGTYTRNDYFTIKIRMTAKNSANIQLGNITLNYYSDN